MIQYAIGTDVGGSHISSVIVDLLENKLVANSLTTTKVDNKADAKEIINCWSENLCKTLKFIENDKLSGIGFAMPGPFDYENGVAKFTADVDKYENLFGLNIPSELKKTGLLPTGISYRFINDATSFAIGESWIGNASRFEKTLAITLGTGFGSAFIDSDIPVLDGVGVPKQGCMWHLPFKDGIADDYFSTRWFINRCFDITGKKLSGVKEIVELAASDERTRNIFSEFGENLGIFMSPWIQNSGVQCIVIGGNVSKAWGLIEKSFNNYMKELIISPEINVSDYGEAAAMMGSARLVNDEFWERIQPILHKM